MRACVNAGKHNRHVAKKEHAKFNLASADVLDLKSAAQCNKKPFQRPLPDAVAVQAMFLRAAKGN